MTYLSKNKLIAFLFLISIIFFSSCEEKTDDLKPAESDAKVRFELKFDPNQQRLNNLAQPVGVAVGNAAPPYVQFDEYSLH